MKKYYILGLAILLSPFFVKAAGSILPVFSGGTGNNSFASSTIPISNGTILYGMATSSLGLQTAGNYITALTGDGTAAGPGSSVLTLATVNSNVGSFTNVNITVDAKGRITAASNGSAGAISSVSNSDGTLTITPTTGAVVSSLNLSHANTWLADQIFGKATSTNFAVTSLATPAGAFLAVNALGSIIATTTPTGGGGGSGTVTSVATNNGLTGGTITTTGTLGLDTTNLLTGAITSWNGSMLASTGTPQLTVGYITATSTNATSTFASGVQAGFGSAARPSFSFIGDTGTGIYRLNTNQLGISAGGSNVLQITATQLVPSVNINSNRSTSFFINQGTGGVSTPIYSFSGDANNGMWASAADTLNFSTNGIERVRIDPSGNVGIGTTTPFAKLSVTSNTGDTNPWIFDVASSSPTFATTSLFYIDRVGHQYSTTTVPVITSCGTSPTIVGNDNSGTVTVGSVVATGCTITFGQPWTSTPSCTVTEQTGSVVNAFSYTVSATAVVVSQTGLTGDILNYQCRGNGI